MLRESDLRNGMAVGHSVPKGPANSWGSGRLFVCVSGKRGKGPISYLSLADHGALHDLAVAARTDVQSAWPLKVCLAMPKAATLLAQGI